MYRSSLALRPQIVKLIDKYSQKRGRFQWSRSINVIDYFQADLVSISETVVEARNIFDRAMDRKLAKHTGGGVCYRSSCYQCINSGSKS